AAPGAASAPAPAADEPGAIAPLPALPPLGFVPLKVVGGEGDGPGQFKAPRGVAVDKRGRVLVADAGNHRVQVLDGEGAFQREITGGSKPFADPVQVAVTSAGEVLVLDAETGLLSRFSADLAFVGEINVASLGLVKARGLFVAADDTLILADASGRKFVAASLSGDVRATVTAPAKGSFGELSAVARNGAGSYFVGDGQQGVIRVLNADGTTINDISFARVDASVGVQFAALPDNGMLATLPEPHKLIRIDARGKPTGEFGGFGVDQGQFRLPTGIAISGDTVWVVETGNHRLQKLRIK
ncbi:MAG: NHL repeat-containing protein, partial [Thermoflexales bacterium]|nr:NHL repeat-containing protein [Thermoflexales bacterium]